MEYAKILTSIVISWCKDVVVLLGNVAIIRKWCELVES